jgi:transposase
MGAGRPTKYNKEYNEQVFKLALLGATDKEIANFFNVEEKTINNWKKKEPEFLQSIKKGKIEADAKVAESLYKRALGYSYTEKKIEEVDEKTSKITWTDKEVVADVAAINIWLKNRRAKTDSSKGVKWQDKPETQSEDQKDTTITFNFGNNSISLDDLKSDE